MRRFWTRHKTLIGLFVITLGIVIFSVTGLRSFDQKGHHFLPLLGGGAFLFLGFKLMIEDERQRSIDFRSLLQRITS